MGAGSGGRRGSEVGGRMNDTASIFLGQSGETGRHRECACACGGMEWVVVVGGVGGGGIFLGWGAFFPCFGGRGLGGGRGGGVGGGGWGGGPGAPGGCSAGAC